MNFTNEELSEYNDKITSAEEYRINDHINLLGAIGIEILSELRDLTRKIEEQTTMITAFLKGSKEPSEDQKMVAAYRALTEASPKYDESGTSVLIHPAEKEEPHGQT